MQTDYTYDTTGGNLLSSTVTNGEQEIQIQNTYDNYGRITAQIDPNGNQITKSYNVLGDVTAMQYGFDNSAETYTYDYPHNKVTYTDLRGTVYVYQYNPSGRLVSMKDSAADQVLESYEYDGAGRKIRQENVLDVASGREVLTTFDGLDRTTEITTKNNQGGIVAREQYLYGFDAAGGLRTIQKTVTGDTNAPSIVSKQYQNQYDWVVKESVTEGANEFFTSYIYDNLGNVLTKLLPLDAADELPYSQKWEYNYANKPIKEYNVLGDYILRTYV